MRGEWLIKHMVSAGQIPPHVTIPLDLVAKVFRPDIYQQMRLLIEDQGVQFYRRSGWLHQSALIVSPRSLSSLE